MYSMPLFRRGQFLMKGEDGVQRQDDIDTSTFDQPKS